MTPTRSTTSFPPFPSPEALRPRPTVRALVGAILEQDEPKVRELLARRAPVNGIAVGGRMPIFAALHTGQLRLTTLLVEAGADVSAQDERGRTPLALTIQVADESPAAEALLRRLLAKRSSLTARDRQGRTPLLNAALAANAMAFGLLLDAGANVFETDQHEASAQNYAKTYACHLSDRPLPTLNGRSSPSACNGRLRSTTAVPFLIRWTGCRPQPPLLSKAPYCGIVDTAATCGCMIETCQINATGALRLSRHS